jgi:hypothetical protein
MGGWAGLEQAQREQNVVYRSWCRDGGEKGFKTAAAADNTGRGESAHMAVNPHATWSHAQRDAA